MIEDEDLLIIYKPHTISTAVGCIYSWNSSQTNWHYLADMTPAIQLSNFDYVRAVSADLSIFSDTISTTNANLSGRMTTVKVYDVGNEVPSYSTLSSFTPLSNHKTVNVALSTGTHTLMRPYYLDFTKTTSLSFDRSHVGYPALTNSVAVTGLNLNTYLDLITVTPTPTISRTLYCEHHVHFTRPVDTDTILTYTVQYTFQRYTMNNGAEVITQQTFVSTYSTNQDQPTGDIFWSDFIRASPFDYLLKAQLIVDSTSVQPVAQDLVVDIDIYCIAPGLTRDGLDTDITIVQGSEGKKNINIAGVINYQIVPKPAIMQQAQLVECPAASFIPLEVFNAMTSTANPYGLSLVMSRTAYSSWYLQFKDNLKTVGSYAATICGHSSTTGTCGLFSFLKPAARAITSGMRTANKILPHVINIADKSIDVLEKAGLAARDSNIAYCTRNQSTDIEDLKLCIPKVDHSDSKIEIEYEDDSDDDNNDSGILSPGTPRDDFANNVASTVESHFQLTDPTCVYEGPCYCSTLNPDGIDLDSDEDTEIQSSYNIQDHYNTIQDEYSEFMRHIDNKRLRDDVDDEEYDMLYEEGVAYPEDQLFPEETDDEVEEELSTSSSDDQRPGDAYNSTVSYCSMRFKSKAITNSRLQLEHGETNTNSKKRSKTVGTKRNQSVFSELPDVGDVSSKFSYHVLHAIIKNRMIAKPTVQVFAKMRPILVAPFVCVVKDPSSSDATDGSVCWLLCSEEPLFQHKYQPLIKVDSDIRANKITSKIYVDNVIDITKEEISELSVALTIDYMYSLIGSYESFYITIVGRYSKYKQLSWLSALFASALADNVLKFWEFGIKATVFSGAVGTLSVVPVSDLFVKFLVWQRELGDPKSFLSKQFAYYKIYPEYFISPGVMTYPTTITDVKKVIESLSKIRGYGGITSSGQYNFVANTNFTVNLVGSNFLACFGQNNLDNKNRLAIKIKEKLTAKYESNKPTTFQLTSETQDISPTEHILFARPQKEDVRFSRSWGDSSDAFFERFKGALQQSLIDEAMELHYVKKPEEVKGFDSIKYDEMREKFGKLAPSIMNEFEKMSVKEIMEFIEQPPNKDWVGVDSQKNILRTIRQKMSNIMASNYAQNLVARVDHHYARGDDPDSIYFVPKGQEKKSKTKGKTSRRKQGKFARMRLATFEDAFDKSGEDDNVLSDDLEGTLNRT